MCPPSTLSNAVGLARSSLQLARSMLAIADAQVSIEELATADVMYDSWGSGESAYSDFVFNTFFSLRRALFRTPLEDYDVVIHLQQPANPRRFQQLETTLKVKKPYHKGGKGSKAGKFGKSGKAGKSGDKTEGSAKRSAAAAAASEDNDDGAVVVEDAVSAAEVGLAGYDPTARYAAELQAEFGHLALFFYDAFGGDKICAIFTPDARAPAHDHATELADRRPFGKKQVSGGCRV